MGGAIIRLTCSVGLPFVSSHEIHESFARPFTAYTCVRKFRILRRNALVEVAPHVEADAVWTKLTRLELWFAPPQGTVVPQPSRLRMALELVVVVYLLVLSIGSGIAIVLADFPFEARLLVTITIAVCLLTYVLMPRLTRWLARWIYPHTVVR